MGINTGGPTLSQLRAFVAVAEFLHFTQAAAELGVSQPTLSAKLSGCEEALGSKLVERTTRKVMLTRAGERLLPRARTVLDALEALVAEADETRKPFRGTIRLGVIPTVAPYLLPTVLRGLAQAFPAMTVEVQEERTAALLDGLGAGRVDAAILAVPVDTRGLVVDPIFEEDFVLVAPRGHALSTMESLAADRLPELDVLLLEEGHCLRDQTLDICKGVNASSATRAASLTTLTQLVSAGMGVTVLPETAVAVEVKRAGLAVTRFAPPAPRRRIALVYRESTGRVDEYAAVAAQLRRVVRIRRLPVRLTGDEALAS
ncbi:hydrogen peroxide-inducible genes activator [Actinokineospora xionganensis]|uniref:Probable hydrogen peroxide-inducible genes activator n=1 Tax=Actinokineospora xionganensis TaxID=2684470 RepID=A0ABR7L3J8_9PSEU|nr:hydrogen peroxide-inducible genes activator [Actinokineospora xionganensis]MBC6447269.1 hydrogen peroxide-inducible genes activator [Actinokineospora xionganensis]